MIATTTPSGLIIPTPAPTGFQTSPSGLLLPTLSTPTIRQGGFVVAKAEELENIPAIAAARLSELAAEHGAPAADAMYGATMNVVDTARRQIEHDRIIAMFTNGGMVAAAAAATQGP